MTEEVTQEIRDILDKSQPAGKGSEEGAVHINVGDIINNKGTVVIGGNVNQGRREEDKPGGGDGSHGRRASDRALHQELRSLRRQVRTLKQLVTHLYARCTVNAVKRPACAAAPCRTSSGTTGARQVNVSNYHPPACADRQAAESRAIRGFRSHQPTPTHINPGISFLLAPNTDVIRRLIGSA
jgi:hypothetical protein